MLYPSIDELMKKIDSKYSLVSVAAKRARELQKEENPLMKEYVSFKPVGKALEEIYTDNLTYQIVEQDTDEAAEHTEE